MNADAGDAGLRREIIAALERTIWTPGDGVRDLDRVEAVQLLGRFRDPVAEAALQRVLREGMAQIRPAPLGRLLRDTALDTLLRSTMLPRAATDRALARYYNFGGRLLRGRLERNVIYDDIPLLVRHGRGGLVLRAYVLPLVALLIALVVLAVGLAGAGGLLAGNEFLGAALGLVFFIALGLGLFNLHQVGLVLLLVAWGRRWPLPWLPRAGSKAATAVILALIAFGLGLYAALRLLFLVARGYNDAGGREVAGYLLVLPLLALPCYMLAHDLEVAPPAAGETLRRGPAVALRWASGFIYVIFVLDAYGLTWIQQARAGFRSFGGDLDVLLGMLLWLLYLVLAPLPVLLVLSALGWLSTHQLPSMGADHKTGFALTANLSRKKLNRREGGNEVTPHSQFRINARSIILVLALLVIILFVTPIGGNSVWKPLSILYGRWLPITPPLTATPGRLPAFYQGGFKAVHDAFPDLIGDPLENEWFDNAGNIHQRTSRGELIYIMGTNNFYFTGKGSAGVGKLYMFTIRDGLLIDVTPK